VSVSKVIVVQGNGLLVCFISLETLGIKGQALSFF